MLPFKPAVVTTKNGMDYSVLSVFAAHYFQAGPVAFAGYIPNSGYNELAFYMGATHDGVPGSYFTKLYLNRELPILLGRDLLGYPKVFGTVEYCSESSGNPCGDLDAVQMSVDMGSKANLTAVEATGSRVEDIYPQGMDLFSLITGKAPSSSYLILGNQPVQTQVNMQVDPTAAVPIKIRSAYFKDLQGILDSDDALHPILAIVFPSGTMTISDAMPLEEAK